MMTPKERVHGLFNGQMPDKVPIYFSGISSSVASAILGREAYVGGGIQQYREVKALWDGPEAHAEFLERSAKDALDLAIMFECDIVRTSYWRLNRKPNAKIDDITYMFKEDDNRELVMRFDPEHELFYFVSGQMEMTSKNLGDYVESVEQAAAECKSMPTDRESLLKADAQFNKTRALYGGCGLGLPHDAVWFEAILTQPELVYRLLEAQTHIALKVLEGYAALPIDLKLIFGGGDMASQHGPFYSPELYKKFFVHRYRKITEKAHKLGMFHLFASDGKIWPVTDDLFGTKAVDGYYEIDLLAGMDLPTLRRKYPDLVLLGGIASKTMHLGTKDDIRREAEAALSAAKQYGRIVVGVSNQVISHTPPGNFVFLMDYLRDNR